MLLTKMTLSTKIFQEHEVSIVEIFVPLSLWLNETSRGVEPSIFSLLAKDYETNLFEKTLGYRAERTWALIPTVTARPPMVQ